jgi:multisubunit Na+/H+ antiporter MnhB subunit
MTDPMLVFDVVLAVSLVSLAWTGLAARDAFTMVVLFIVLGLMVALAWVRLRAPDVALAEAAIGAGVTGALLLVTLRHLRGAISTPETHAAPGAVTAVTGVLCALVTLGLGAAFLTVPLERPGLETPVAANMGMSGVEHPVTAVLLNFRAYDTLMELVVLLAAVVVVWMVERGIAGQRLPVPMLGSVYTGFARVALPVMTMAGAYLVWIGAVAPGGAFQGGAVLAGVAILLILARSYGPMPGHRPAARLAFVLGTAVFTGVALAVSVGPRLAFEYPPADAKTLILVIEAAVTISIAATLAALVFGREPARLPVRAGGQAAGEAAR